MNAPASVHRFARATALATFVLILAGASVTSTDSGLAVPDWPRSYGQWMPPMQGGVFFEHGHRMIAGLVAAMVWILAFLAWRRASGMWVRRLTLVAGVSVLVQALLGGITVLYGLAKPVSIVHACLAQSLFALLVFLAVSTAEHTSAVRERPPKAALLFRLAVAAAVAVYLQLVMGAAYRHGLAGIHPHLAGAALTTVFVLLAAVRAVSDFPSNAGVAAPGIGLSLAILAQLFLGLFAFLSRSPVAATAHVGIGALLLALCVVLSAKAYRLAFAAEEPGRAADYAPGTAREESGRAPATAWVQL